MKLSLIVLFTSAYLSAATQTSYSVLTQKYQEFKNLNQKNKIHLILNQEKFYPGDTVFFKAYFVNANLIGIKGKNQLEINLFDSEGMTILNQRTNVTDGIGKNQLIIPDTLKDGLYLITAHPSWLKNADKDLVFSRQISVVSGNKIIAEEKDKLLISVEGGHFLKDIDNSVSIVSNKAGTNVEIINDAGQIISEIRLDNEGIGSFIIKPEAGKEYFARMTNTVKQFTLPKVENDGIGLQLIKPENNTEEYLIRLKSYEGSSLTNELIQVILSNHSKAQFISECSVGTKEHTDIKLPQATLYEGLNTISILDKKGTCLAYRSFYYERKKSVTASIQIENKYFTREKVAAHISLSDSIGNPIKGEFNIRVINSNIVQSEKRNSLSDALSIIPYLKEDTYFNRLDSGWQAKLDSKLIQLGEPPQWDEILSAKNNKKSLSNPATSIKVGKAYYKDSKKPANDLDIIFYLQKNKSIQQTRIENGRVTLFTPEFEGEDDLFFISETYHYVNGAKHGEEFSNLIIEWEGEKASNFPSRFEWRKTTQPDEYAAFSKNKQIIQNSFQDFSPESIKPSQNDFEEEVAKADISIDVQKYDPFPTMTELIKEVIPSLYHRKIGKKNIVRANLSTRMSPKSTGDPVYIIDGIATKNTTFFLSLKPIEILKVKIINDENKLLPLGLFGKNGIVLVQTKAGNQSEPDRLITPIKGLNRSLDFNLIDYSLSKNANKPFFRSTLYWNSSIKTDSNGKGNIDFFCTDDIGSMMIEVQGITDGGKPFSVVKQFEIVPSKLKN